MDPFSERAARRAANPKGLAAFGATLSGHSANALSKVVRAGSTVTVYTVGYERRDGEGLMSLLLDQNVSALADVRERPVSRKPDFRANALRDLCESAGIEYQAWPALGSTDEQREELQASGNFDAFATEFRAHALRTMSDELARLAASVRRIPTALLCYERRHEECHRSVIADLVAKQIDATIVALL